MHPTSTSPVCLQQNVALQQRHVLSVAPMMDWTDRHCRYFHRLLTKRALLYTEMVTTGALLHGDVARHLRFHSQEHPLALQLGGSEPADLARCARLGQAWGYDEINLNCGCPSPRVQRGAFGACLMAQAALVAQCLRAMQDAVSIPVTVKHRIGLDHIESDALMRDFVGQLSQAGCRTFIVHARNAWLQGLSPKENRERPPLRYHLVHQLKKDFPHLTIVINGGITNSAQVLAQLQQVDGVMVGRAAYHDPWWLSQWDSDFLGAPPRELDHDAVEESMVAYMAQETQQHGTPWPRIAKHMLGLRQGQAGAKKWRQVWSDQRLYNQPAQAVFALARQAQAVCQAA
jgi:tRNA-dihydrouridine synthase A